VGVRLQDFSAKLYRSILYCIALQLSLSLVPVSGAATYVVPDQRDRDVLNALLIHLCSDVGFDLTKVSTNHAQILLHYRTPGKTGSLTTDQIQSDLRTNSLPVDAEDNLRKRNGLNVEKPGDYETVAALFGNVKFSPAIVVTNLHNWRIEPQILKSGFNKTFPNDRGWLEAYLPGYSNDGNQAVVRATIGPWVHGASLTALMEKREIGWIVKWYKIAYYV
jgi:hypothetical protein